MNFKCDGEVRRKSKLEDKMHLCHFSPPSRPWLKKGTFKSLEYVFFGDNEIQTRQQGVKRSGLTRARGGARNFFCLKLLCSGKLLRIGFKYSFSLNIFFLRRPPIPGSAFCQLACPWSPPSQVRSLDFCAEQLRRLGPLGYGGEDVCLRVGSFGKGRRPVSRYF